MYYRIMNRFKNARSHQRPTLREVAAQAGVSVGTVSNVLNGRAHVRDATRMRVESTIAELGFRPNLLARTLTTRSRSAPAPSQRRGLPRLVTVGYVSVDYTARIDTYPCRGARLSAQAIEKTLGGPATNVAVYAAGLGTPWPVNCEIVTALGDDPDSDWALTELAERGVDTVRVEVRPDQRLSRCFILVESDGSRTIINEPMTLGEANVVAALGPSPSKGKKSCLHVEGFQLPRLLPAMREARARGFVTSAQSTGLPRDWRSAAALKSLIGAVDILFVDAGIARQTTGCDGSPDDLVAAFRRVHMSVPKAQRALVIMTLSENGAAVLLPGGKPKRIGAPTVEVVDTTGAGDTFVGIFLATWLNRATPEEAARMASYGASLSVTVEGAQGRPITASDLAHARPVGHRARQQDPAPLAPAQL